MLHDERWDLDEDGKVIWEVANYIEEHGWVQGGYDHGEAVCILGAYKKLGLGHFHVSTKRIYSFIKSNGQYGIVDYNDTPGRTKEEVITMLKQAARSK